jgi:hypothetical protein
MRRDKIFDNNFDSPEFEYLSNFTFDLDPVHKDLRSEEEKIQVEMISRDIHELIEVSRFKVFNEVDEQGKTAKLKKVDINEVYGYIIDEMAKDYTLIDIFSEMCVYFDINPSKFYNSLSNAYKEELVAELDKKTNILDKKNIKKLF